MSSEAAAIADSLIAVVDIGSNGIRCSISSLASHHSRILPCVYQDRIGISLFDAQYIAASSDEIPDAEVPAEGSAVSNGKGPIPDEVIAEICAALRRFKIICGDFGISDKSRVHVIATEATRQATNSIKFRNCIVNATDWPVKVLSKEEEATIGAYGAASSFYRCEGLFMDLGGGSCQLSWIRSRDGTVELSETPVSLPYGAAALTRRLGSESMTGLLEEVVENLREGVVQIGIPPEFRAAAEASGGFNLYVSGGGFRGFGYLLLNQQSNYPVASIINGFSAPRSKLEALAQETFLRPSGRPVDPGFRLSERRRSQLPAVALLVSAVCQALPRIKKVHFAQGGVREGFLYLSLPPQIRSQDPLLVASAPYAPLRASEYLKLLRSALPSFAPEEIVTRTAPALANLAFVHSSYPKDLQSAAALRIATTGIIAGTHGLSHRARALIGLALCERWGGELAESEERHRSSLIWLVDENDNNISWRGLPGGDQVRAAKRLAWWSRYIGRIMHVICGVYPGGNVKAGAVELRCEEKGERKFALEVRYVADDRTASYSVRHRIVGLEKKLKRISKEHGVAPGERVKVVLVEMGGDGK